MTHPLDEPHADDDEIMTLTFIARALEMSSDKAIYIARSRHKQRVARGRVEEPFPEVANVTRQGYEEFRLGEVRVWLQGHTRQNNPQTRTKDV